MRKIMEHLLAIQNYQLNARGHTPAVLAEIAQRRAEVPAPVLAHFERMIARGKKGVAVVRDGVCTECHLRLTTGKLARLAADTDIWLCDNCGRYLYLSEAEKVGVVAIPSAKPLPVKRPAVKTAHHVA
jgi:predicted  nucleic acid-binding Zn-ribbon protein